MDDSGQINLNSTIINRLTNVVRRLCQTEQQISALKAEFNYLKNEVTNLTGILVTGAEAEANTNNGPRMPETVIRELTFTADSFRLIDAGQSCLVSAGEEDEQTPVSTVAEVNPPISLIREVNEPISTPLSVGNNTEEIACKKRKVNGKAPIEYPVLEPEDGKDYVQAFASGACEDNRTWGRAGIGVFFGAGSSLNCSLPIEGARSTLNAASINACIEALRIGLENGIKMMTIRTDSEFTHNCITKWMDNWKQNNWKKFRGGKVKFKTELERLDKLSGHFKELEWILEMEDMGFKEAKDLAYAGVLKHVDVDVDDY